MVMATLLFSGADALAKLIAQQYPFMQVIWFRSLFGLLLIMVAIAGTRNWRHFYTQKPMWHLSRSLVGIILTTGIFMGLKYIPLAEVSALVFANPLIVAVYSSLFMKEKVGAGTFAAIIIGFLGVLLVVRPTPDHFHAAHLFMLGFAAATAFLIITARKLADTESVLTLNLYLYPATLLFSSVWAFSDWVWPDLTDWLVILGVSLCATLALFCVTQSLRYARPAQVAPFDYTRILWAVGIGYIFWDEVPGMLTWAGIMIIVVCGIYIVTRGRVLPQAEAATPPAATR